MANLGGFVKSLRDIMRMDSGISGDAQRIEQISWLLFLKIYDAKEEDWEFADMDYESIIPEEYRWRNWATPDAEGKALTGDALLEFVNNKLFPTLKTLSVDKDTEIRKAIVRTVFEDTNQYMKDGVQLRQVVNVIDNVDFGSYEETHAFGEIYENFLKELQSAGSAGEFYTPRAVTDFMADQIDPQVGETCADFACGTGGFLTSWLRVLEPKVKTAEERKAFDESIHGMEKKQFPYTLCITNMLLHGIDSPDIRHGNSLSKNILDFTDEDKFDVCLMNPPYGGSEKNDIKSHFPADLRSSETADLFMSVIMYRLKEGGRAAVILPDGFLFGTDGAKVAIKKKLMKEFNLHTVVRMPGSVFAPYTSITTNILFFDKNSGSDGTGGGTKEVWFYRLDIPEGYKHFSKTKPMKREHFAPVDDWWGNRVEIKDQETDTWKSKKYSAAEIEAGGYNLDLCGYPTEEKVILSPEETLDTYISEREKLETELSIATAALKDNLEGKPAELTNIGNIANRLSVINTRFPKDMRDAILQAAMQGKLTEQLESDGSADELLSEIRKEKDKLLKEGRIKKEKKLPEITEDELPFDIPENWKWVRLGSVIREVIVPQRDKPPFSKDGTIPWCRIEDRDRHLLNGTKSSQYVTKETVDKMNLRVLPVGTVLSACTGGSIGTIVVNTVECCTNQTFNGVVCGDKLYNWYVFWFLTSKFSDLKNMGTGTTIAYISQDKTRELVFPLPPLAEQHRIVARLNELLPLCDTLEEAR